MTADEVIETIQKTVPTDLEPMQDPIPTLILVLPDNRVGFFLLDVDMQTDADKDRVCAIIAEQIKTYGATAAAYASSGWCVQYNTSDPESKARAKAEDKKFGPGRVEGREGYKEVYFINYVDKERKRMVMCDIVREPDKPPTFQNWHQFNEILAKEESKTNRQSGRFDKALEKVRG